MYRIGIDLGGTAIKAGLVDEQHTILAECCVPTEVYQGTAQIIEKLSGIVERLVKKANVFPERVAGVGIGSPGAIDQQNGVVLFSNNFSWENVPLIQLMSEKIPYRCYVANDAQCAALGETVCGAARGCRHVVMLTLGTGVGSGIIVDGKVFDGGGGGGIVGHNAVVVGGERCTCGRAGCLESYASATALIRETKRVYQQGTSHILQQLCEELQSITGKTPFEAAARGDADCQKIITEYIAVLGNGIANLVDIFRPQKVLLGGGISNQGASLYEPLNACVRKNCFAGEKLYIPTVEPAMLGTKAGIVGAAALIPQN